MKLEVGYYVRTENGIKKILKYTYNERYENSHCVWFDNKDCGILFTDEEVNKMKPSPKIIDLIEVGDYVNGSKVIKNTLIGGRNIVIVQGGNCFTNEEIKSIVTKEQMEQMVYKI